MGGFKWILNCSPNKLLFDATNTGNRVPKCDVTKISFSEYVCIGSGS